MVRFAVAVVLALVLLSTTVVSADEARKPPTAAEIRGMIQQADATIKGLQNQIASLLEKKARLEGALNYATIAERYDAETGTCDEGESCGQAQAEVETSADTPDGDAD